MSRDTKKMMPSRRRFGRRCSTRFATLGMKETGYDVFLLCSVAFVFADSNIWSLSGCFELPCRGCRGVIYICIY